jgi:predicted cupin superfamily sugar epimerase
VLGDSGETGVEDWVPQALVPAGSWQGARLAGGPHLPADYAWALVSCIVTPGFSYEDFELGEREALLAAHPQYAELIRDFT